MINCRTGLSNGYTCDCVLCVFGQVSLISVISVCGLDAIIALEVEMAIDYSKIDNISF